MPGNHIDAGKTLAFGRHSLLKVKTTRFGEIEVKQGDVIEIGLQFVAYGRTSITLRCEVRDLLTQKVLIKIEQLVFVQVDDNERPLAHGKTLGATPSV